MRRRGEDKDKGEPVDLWFMPWLNLSHEVTVGRVRFVPAETIIQSSDDIQLKNHITRVLNCCVNEIGEPVTGVAVCRIGDRPGFPELSQDDMIEIRRAKDALCFAAILQSSCSMICKGDYGIYSSAQCFDFIRHKASTGSGNFTLHGSNAIAVNCSYKNYRQNRPFGLSGMAPVSTNSIMNALSKLLISTETSLKDRVFRSLEWARLAHDDTGRVSDTSKIVMMATAFEILLYIGKKKKKKAPLMVELDRLCRSNISECRIDTIDDEDCEFSLMAWWIRDFYKLRNAIVHGDSIDEQELYHNKPTEDSILISKLDVADVIMGDYIWRLLCEDDVVGDDCKRLAQFLVEQGATLSHTELVKQWAPRYSGTREAQLKLGWLKQNDEDIHPTHSIEFHFTSLDRDQTTER